MTIKLIKLVHVVSQCIIKISAIAIIVMPLPGGAQSNGDSKSQSIDNKLSVVDRLVLGEKMYREGLLPSGKPIEAFIKGDVKVDSSAFSCVSCHMRSGLGSLEGGVFTTPTNGRTLYQPRDLPGAGNNRRGAGMSMTDKKKGIVSLQPPAARPAYTDASLATVLQDGVDPVGRVLASVMPRYNLENDDMTILVNYLKNLSTEYSPGVDKDFIRFATVVAPDVPANYVDAMMEPLESFVKSANKQQKDHEAQLVKLREKKNDPTYRRVKLSRWVLKGTPDTWRVQLDDYYRNEPVFALIAGISTKGWQPVHDFAEENKIPCLLPNTDFPVISDTDWYTLYFSKGFQLEGSTAARYLNSLDVQTQEKKIIQIVRDSPQGKELAAGFEVGLKEIGLKSPVSIILDAKEQLSAERFKEIIEKEQPEAIALWVEAADLKNLAGHTFTKGKMPILMVSSGLLGKGLWTLPEEMRTFAYITYPYRLPNDEARFDRFLKKESKDKTVSDELRIIQGRTYAALRVLTQALREVKGNFYRDHLFDVIGMSADIEFPLYERLSFGPGQRYASKGCYIVQLSAGVKPELIKRSEWVIH